MTKLGRTSLASALLCTAAVGCAGIKKGSPTTTDAGSPDSGAGGAGGPGNGGTGGGGTGGMQPAPLTDFPVDPIFVDPSIPGTAPSLFNAGPARSGSAPCITSPEASTLMPRNWLRPRIDYLPAGSESLFEVVWTIPGFSHPLRIYTRTHSYTLDKDLWDRMRTSVTDVSITVTVKALQLDTSGAVQLGPSEPARTTFIIAPVDAPGKIVYWALSGGLGSLKGFGIGEEGTQDVLVPSQVVAKTANETCIGCHSATPDGDGVGFALGEGFYYDSIADIRQTSAGAVPSYVTPSALAALRKLGGIPAYSKAHWSAGDRIAILSDTGDLHWIQVDGTNQGIVARSGDTRLATEPTFRHDGTALVYVSIDSIVYGRASGGPADLYEVPFAGGAGGPAIPLVGAAEADYTEYYPAFSPDDAFVAFTRIGGAGDPYSNAQAEVLVVPSSGGTAQRLKANDAPACQPSLTSPGLTNDWPKWSPDAGQANGKTYYWLTFSSTRTGVPQLYVTALVVEGGALSTFPALYLWNQPAADGNHTPSWDNYQIPPVIIP